MAGTPTRGVINNSYVSKRKPIAATAMMSHCVSVRPLPGALEASVEFIRVSVQTRAMFSNTSFLTRNKTFGLGRCSCHIRTGKRRLSVMFGLVLAVAQGLCAELDLDLPTNDGFIGFNAKERRFTAAVESSPLKKVMAKLGTATGWKVYIDPGAQRTVSAQFTNRTSGEALRMLLGGLNFALVPQEGGPSKLLVFQNSAKDATEFVEPTKAKAVSKDRIPNELVVSLSRNSKRDIESLARSLGAKIVGRNDKLRSYRLQFDSEDAANNARNQLASAPDVRVDDNYYLHTPDPGFQLAGGPT